MRLVTFSQPTGGDASATRVGACSGDEVLDLTTASLGDPIFESMLALIDAGAAGLKRASALMEQSASKPRRSENVWYTLGSVRLAAPIPRPRKNVYCVGLNFASHVRQNALALGQDFEIPEVPLFFSKPPTAVVGPGDGICWDGRLTDMLDYEVELAAVIGVGGTWISPEDVWDHIFGFTLVNDVSARDLQWRTSQFFYGKGQDTYCPMGPAIVTLDELVPLGELFLELYVNGERRQREAAGNMLFSPEVAISELSRGITLEPGDVVSLGTPGGCGYQMIERSFLRPGDTVECRATGIGSMVNPVVDASERTVQAKSVGPAQ